MIRQNWHSCLPGNQVSEDSSCGQLERELTSLLTIIDDGVSKNKGKLAENQAEKIVIPSQFQIEKIFLGWLATSNPCEIVDGGAGMGHWVQKVKRAGIEGNFQCFEPFETNTKLYEKSDIKDSDIHWHSVALYRNNQTVKFTIRETVQGPDKPGYSSLGRIALDRHKILNNEIETNVQAVRLDSVLTTPIDLLKLDLQGGEYEALVGAEELFKTNAIKSLLIEFSGDHRCLDLIHQHGFTIFDNEVTANFDANYYKGEISITKRVVKSTGVPATRFYFQDQKPTPFIDYCDRFKNAKKKGNYMQTDLIAIQNELVDQFEEFQMLSS